MIQKKTRHPRLRAMQIAVKRKNLGIPEGKHYTSAEAVLEEEEQVNARAPLS